jgi:hypothetical protein
MKRSDRPDDGDHNLVEVRQALHSIGEGLLVDGRILSPDPVADRAVGDSRKFETYGKLSKSINQYRYF